MDGERHAAALVPVQGGWRRLLRRHRWLRRLALAAVVTPAVIAVLGFWVAPPIVRRVAEKQLGTLLGRRVTVARVRVNPFALSVTIDGLRVMEPDATTPFFGFARLYVNLEAASVYRRGPVVREIRLESPRLRIVRTSAGAGLSGYNFSDILARLSAGPKAPAAPANAPLPRFSLNNVRLIDGDVTFEDRPTASRHELAGLDVGVPFVSTLPVYVDTFVDPGLRVKIDGAPFVIDGRTKPFKDSLESTLALRVTSLDLTRFVPYAPVRLPFDVRSALLNVALDVSFVRPRDGAPTLSARGRVALDRLTVADERSSLAWNELEVVLQKADLGALRFAIDRIALVGLDVRTRRLRDGNLALMQLLPAEPETPHDKAKASKPASGERPRFELKEVLVDKAALRLVDESVQPPFTFAVKDLTLAVRGLSNAPGARASVTLALHAAPGGTLQEHGTFSLRPLAATGTLSLDGLEPARFAPYFRDLVTFDIVDARLRLGARFRFEQAGEEPRFALDDGELALTDVTLRKRSSREDFFRMGGLAVRGLALDPARRSLSVAEVATHDGRLRIERDAAGVVDLTTLIPPSTPSAPAPAAEPPWTVSLGTLQIERWSARLEDRAVDPKAVIAIAPLALHASNLTTAPGGRGNVDLRLGVNGGGRVAIAGSLGLSPLAADLHVGLRAIEILPLQPYFADQVSLTVTDGTVSVDGRVRIASGRAGAPIGVSFDGNLDVASFASVDGDEGDPLVSWRSLHVGGLAASTAPARLAIHDVTLADFFAQLMIQPDARFNLESVATPAKASAPHPAPQTPPAAPSAPASPPITIGELTLTGGRIAFADHLIRPSYAAELTDLGGRLSGLSSDASTQADVDLHGSVDHTGTLTIAGKVNPLAKDLFVDLKVDLKDFELPPTSPYAAKYAGYGIGKGKLGLSLAYRIDRRKLDAHNRLIIDQLTWGDKVSSPAATKLPVRLAVALLKDRRGVIDVDLPIVGSLDDPDFKIGRAILKVLGNLVVKAVTAPFTLIASAFGGGDQLSHVDFAPGLAALDAAAVGKVRALGTALRERPGLALEIEGRADRARDGEGLRHALYERKLRAQRVLELVKGGAAVASPDDVVVTPAERPHLLEMAYAAETFTKPRNFLGIDKSLPPPEMERLILAHIVVGDDGLRALAQERATAVREALGKAAPESAGHLFLVAPRTSDGPGSRVELKLKAD